jgi:hypothetical protein
LYAGQHRERLCGNRFARGFGLLALVSTSTLAALGIPCGCQLPGLVAARRFGSSALT